MKKHSNCRPVSFLRLVAPLLLSSAPWASGQTYDGPWISNQGGWRNANKYQIINLVFAPTKGTSSINSVDHGWGWMDFYSNTNFANVDPWTPKAYPCVINGEHWNLKSKPSTRLRTPVWEKRNYNAQAYWSVSNVYSQNVAYDIWFHDALKVGSSPSAELMVWLGKFGAMGAMGAAQPTTVSYAGYSWKVHTKSDRTIPVRSYVPLTNIYNSNLNLTWFINNAAWSRPFLKQDGSQYVTAIELGTESSCTPSTPTKLKIGLYMSGPE